MAFNSRMNQHGHGGHQQQGGGRSKKKEDDSDALMRLPDREIAGCINDIGVPFSVADLVKPNPQQIQLVFESFAELLMNATRETVEPAMRAAAEDICPDHVDLIPPDTRNLMGFFMSLRKLMVECGVNDFAFTDLTKPTHDRLVKIFSYLINFVRFRETQTSVIDKHFSKSETTKARIEALYAENQEMQQRLAEMSRQQKAMEGPVNEKIKRNDELKIRLLELRRSQERVAETLERVKMEKARKQTYLEEMTEKILKSKQESEKLRPYVLQSPASLQASLTELSDSLTRDKLQIDNMERRMQDIALELQKEEEEDARAIRNRDALTERGNTVREVAQTEKLLQRQLARWHERTEALRRSSREKQESAQARMEELREIQKQLREERAEKQRDMERRRIRIEQTEKKMVDLKENIENEIHNAHDEYLKLESHIKLYITEMEKCL
ncbi:kinetochore-associated Ndc80 complex subunit nuf2 [Blastomyces gilchristii]